MGFYNKYSDYLRDKHGCKVYKLPIELGLSCPNRTDNNILKGCTFCSTEGAGFENLSKDNSIENQLLTNMAKIKKNYKADKFIAYLQNYSNTYLPLDGFKSYINEIIAAKNNNSDLQIVEIAIATRPDCINDKYLDFLLEVKNSGINITLELGLQTANYHTLNKINRGHSLAEFIDSVNRIKSYGFLVCTHVILDLPYDNMLDVIETSKIISVLNVDFVKLHSLYIVKNSQLEKEYLSGELKLLTVDDYIKRVAIFIEYSAKNIVFQRIIGRVPEEDSVYANFNMSWWKIKDMIDEYMLENNSYQGKNFNYTNGSALKNMN